MTSHLWSIKFGCKSDAINCNSPLLFCCFSVSTFGRTCAITSAQSCSAAVLLCAGDVSLPRLHSGTSGTLHHSSDGSKSTASAPRGSMGSAFHACSTQSLTAAAIFSVHSRSKMSSDNLGQFIAKKTTNSIIQQHSKLD